MWATIRNQMTGFIAAIYGLSFTTNTSENRKQDMLLITCWISKFDSLIINFLDFVPHLYIFFATFCLRHSKIWFPFLAVSQFFFDLGSPLYLMICPFVIPLIDSGGNCVKNLCFSKFCLLPLVPAFACGSCFCSSLPSNQRGRKIKKNQILSINKRK